MRPKLGRLRDLSPPSLSLSQSAAEFPRVRMNMQIPQPHKVADENRRCDFGQETQQIKTNGGGAGDVTTARFFCYSMYWMAAGQLWREQQQQPKRRRQQQQHKLFVSASTRKPIRDSQRVANRTNMRDSDKLEAILYSEIGQCDCGPHWGGMKGQHKSSE